MTFDSLRTLSPMSKRILTVGTFFVLSIMITIAGVLTPLSTSEAEDLNHQLEQLQQDVHDMTVGQATQAIFMNNFLISLIMFVPLAGPFFGAYALYNTGRLIAASSITSGDPALPVFLVLFIFPFTWMEFLAYSIALTESVWLTWKIVQRKALRELIRTLALVAVCGVILLVAAYIESVIIASVI